MSHSTLLDLRAVESCVIRHVKPPHYGEASRKPRALIRGAILLVSASFDVSGFDINLAIAVVDNARKKRVH